MSNLVRKSLEVPASEYEATGILRIMRQRTNARYRAYRLNDPNALEDFHTADDLYWKARKTFMESWGIPLYRFVECYPKRDPDQPVNNLSYEFVWWDGEELTGTRKLAYDMVLAVTKMQYPYIHDVIKEAHELAKRNGIYIAHRRFIDLSEYGQDYKKYTVTEWSPEHFPQTYEFVNQEEAEAFALMIESKL